MYEASRQSRSFAERRGDLNFLMTSTLTRAIKLGYLNFFRGSCRQLATCIENRGVNRGKHDLNP